MLSISIQILLSALLHKIFIAVQLYLVLNLLDYNILISCELLFYWIFCEPLFKASYLFLSFLILVL